MPGQPNPKSSAAPPSYGAQAPTQSQTPAQAQGQGAYPQATAYRQYLQSQTPGAHMSYNQFVESQGGPSPGMTPTGPGAGGPGMGTPANQAPISPEGYQAYRQLGTIQNNKAQKAAINNFRSQYGSGYDPKGYYGGGPKKGSLAGKMGSMITALRNR